MGGESGLRGWFVRYIERVGEEGELRGLECHCHGTDE